MVPGYRVLSAHLTGLFLKLEHPRTVKLIVRQAETEQGFPYTAPVLIIAHDLALQSDVPHSDRRRGQRSSRSDNSLSPFFLPPFPFKTPRQEHGGQPKPASGVH